MISTIQAIVLGVVQGLTEFLPVSSSAHLILVPWLLRWRDPGLAFDVVLHLGTLLALLAYYWHVARRRTSDAATFAVPVDNRVGSRCNHRAPAGEAGRDDFPLPGPH